MSAFVGSLLSSSSIAPVLGPVNNTAQGTSVGAYLVVGSSDSDKAQQGLGQGAQRASQVSHQRQPPAASVQMANGGGMLFVYNYDDPTKPVAAQNVTITLQGLPANANPQ